MKKLVLIEDVLRSAMLNPQVLSLEDLTAKLGIKLRKETQPSDLLEPLLDIWTMILGQDYHSLGAVVTPKVLVLLTVQSDGSLPPLVNVGDTVADAKTAASYDKDLQGYGYRMATRKMFLFGSIKMLTYEHSPNSTPEEIAKSHANVLSYLRREVTMRKGKFVIYDPEDDATGWLAVGDDPQLLRDETLEMIANTRD